MLTIFDQTVLVLVHVGLHVPNELMCQQLRFTCIRFDKFRNVANLDTSSLTFFQIIFQKQSTYTVEANSLHQLWNESHDHIRLVLVETANGKLHGNRVVGILSRKERQRLHGRHLGPDEHVVELNLARGHDQVGGDQVVECFGNVTHAHWVRVHQPGQVFGYLGILEPKSN